MTATAIPLHGNGAASTERARTIVSDSLASMASSSPIAAAKTVFNGARTWVSQMLSKLGLGRLYTWVRGYVAPALAWSRGLLATAGVGSVTAFGLTTHRGRGLIFHTIPGAAYAVVKAAVRTVLYLPRRLLCKFSFGRRAVGYVLASVVLSERFVSDSFSVVETWLEERHDSLLMRALRNVLWFGIVNRILHRFVVARWARVFIQAVMLFMPTTTLLDPEATYENDTDVVATVNDSPVSTAIDTVLALVSDKPKIPVEAAVETTEHVEPEATVEPTKIYRSADVAAAQATAAAQPPAPAAGNREQQRQLDKARDRQAAIQRRAHANKGQ